MSATHVMLVDDNPQALEILELRLRSLGYRITTCHNGEVALAEVKRDRPAVVVLDVTMPELNGYQACREMKRIDKTIGVLILTAKTDPADRFWAKQVGADAYMTKPADPAAVAAKISELLARS